MVFDRGDSMGIFAHNLVDKSPSSRDTCAVSRVKWIGASLCAGFMAFASSAQAATPLVPNKGDTAWVMISTAFVLLMSVPGLALFYGGLVRSKNMLSVLSQIFAIVAMVMLMWVTFGYSLTFTNGGDYNLFIGGFSKVFMAGITPESTVSTFSNGVVIPELAYLGFQMTFACITPALIVGALAERVRFSTLLVFTALWMVLVYFPIAHMVWYWAGPDEIAAAAKALNEATASGQAAAISAAQAALAKVKADAGLMNQWGALDFAGGTVVHINAGVAGLVGCFMIGKRIGYRRELMAPHSLTMTLIGSCLLWFGWIGFNAGSNLEANGTAALTLLNTCVASAAGALAWLLVEWVFKHKPSLLGMLSGSVSGLVAVTPASGFAGPMGCLVLGLVAGILCFFGCTILKNRINYDDSLDAFGIHGVGGIVGALATGLLVNPSLGGVGIPDYEARPGELVSAAYAMGPAMWAQLKAVAFTVVWSGVISLVLFKILDIAMGLRVSSDEERQGLDVAEHGERAYNH
jgi:ammonium transporter, Amt family